MVFLHILKVPGASGLAGGQPAIVKLPALKQTIVSAHVLTGDGHATFTQTDSNVTLTLPRESLDPLDTIIKLECDAPIGH